jgi:hypothetical protein
VQQTFVLPELFALRVLKVCTTVSKMSGSTVRSTKKLYVGFPVIYCGGSLLGETHQISTANNTEPFFGGSTYLFKVREVRYHGRRLILD